MNRRGIEFTLTQAQPGLWHWQFQIGKSVMNGKTETNLRGMAVHRVQQRILNPRQRYDAVMAADGLFQVEQIE